MKFSNSACFNTKFGSCANCRVQTDYKVRYKVNAKTQQVTQVEANTMMDPKATGNWKTRSSLFSLFAFIWSSCGDTQSKEH